MNAGVNGLRGVYDICWAKKRDIRRIVRAHALSSCSRIGPIMAPKQDIRFGKGLHLQLILAQMGDLAEV